MATVVQSPDNPSLLRNVKSFMFSSSLPIVFKLMKGTAVLLEETYHPDSASQIEVDVMQVLSEQLHLSLPASDSHHQSEGYGTFTYYIDGVQISSFTVVAGGVRKATETAANFLAANFLTWQPQNKPVAYHQPEYLTYYHQAAGKVKAKLYKKAGGTETVLLYTCTQVNRMMTYNVTMSHIFRQAAQDEDQYYGVADVWVENNSGTRLSYIQRYAFNPLSASDHFFLAVNSLGGIDTFAFSGGQHLVPGIEYEVSAQGDEKIPTGDVPVRRYLQNTGYMSSQDKAWLWDFFASDCHWALMDSAVEKIVLDASSIDISDKEDVNDCSFNFVLASDGTLLNVERTLTDLSPVQIESPDGELFFLPPRIVDFPSIAIDDSLLFLVQTPFYQSWRKLSIAALREWISGDIAEQMHTHGNLSVLNQLTSPETGKVAYGQHLIAYMSDVSNRLRKDAADSASAVITFLDGLKVGSYTSGLTGQGGSIDSSGNAELESLFLRRFLEVPELRFNRVDIELGNKWNAPGGGLIESVVPDYDADHNVKTTGTITLHLEDGELGAVAEDDICMGIFHLQSGNADADADDSRGNFEYAGYGTCYFRVTQILDDRAKTLKYQIRGLSARWQNSMLPQASMRFVAYGNFADTDRQVSRYSTRTYERYLAHVNTWEISSNMIMAQFGDLSNLDVFGLDMSGYSAYLNNIYMSGTIKQLEELPLRIEIDTQGDNFLAYGEEMTVTCHVWRGLYKDVTEDVTAWSISRDTGDAAADAAWLLKSKVQNFDGSIVLCYKASDSDLSDDPDVVSTLFTVTCSLNGQLANAQIEI